ncbi:MAG: hypothetical protein J7K82_06565, partial [Thermoproteales archaeon]|nr:hypothetical protein [Thermoproteales archaeon]
MKIDNYLWNTLSILLIFFILSTPYVVSAPQYTKSIKASFSTPKVISKIFDKYSLILIDNTDLLLKPEHPIVPVKVIHLKLPLHTGKILVNVSVEFARLNGTYRLLPAPQPQKLVPKPLNASLYIENPEIYSSEAPYPARPYDYEVKHGIDPVTLERVTYLIVRVYPVRYVPATGQVYYAMSANISVKYTLTSTPQALQATVDIIVITPEALLTPAQQLAQWKNSTGYVAKVYTLEWITANFPGADAQEKIRNFINYTVNNFDAKYVILLGDSDQI